MLPSDVFVCVSETHDSFKVLKRVFWSKVNLGFDAGECIFLADYIKREAGLHCLTCSGRAC